MLLTGTCTYRWLLLEKKDSLKRLHRLVLSASFSLFAAILMRAWAHTYVAFGTDALFSWESIQIVATKSRWGERWQWQLWAASASLIASILIYFRPRTGWLFLTAGALCVCVSLPLTGHAMAHEGSRFATVTLQALHIMGASLWLGTLAVAVVQRRNDLSVLERFYPLAFTGTILLVTSGLTMAYLYLPSLDTLWTSAYGKVLTLKLFVLTGILTCGFLNWRRFRSIVKVTHGGHWVTIELTLATLVLAATGLLSELPNP